MRTAPCGLGERQLEFTGRAGWAGSDEVGDVSRQMETMRECCALALMHSRKREQLLSLARDRAAATLRQVCLERQAQNGKQLELIATLEGMVGGVLVAVEGVARQWGAERARLLEVERELKEELGAEEGEMQVLQEKMSLALMWASP